MVRRLPPDALESRDIQPVIDAAAKYEWFDRGFRAADMISAPAMKPSSQPARVSRYVRSARRSYLEMSAFPAQLQAALDAYRNERTAATWTALSQTAIGDLTVLDALKALEPEFPDPLPLPVDGLIEDETQFYQWPVLPDPDEVERALRAM